MIFSVLLFWVSVRLSDKQQKLNKKIGDRDLNLNICTSDKSHVTICTYRYSIIQLISYYIQPYYFDTVRCNSFPVWIFI